jgi:hypothetical protein
MLRFFWAWVTGKRKTVEITKGLDDINQQPLNCADSLAQNIDDAENDTQPEGTGDELEDGQRQSATITPIRQVIAHCTRCNAWITEGQTTVTVTVAHETWQGGEVPSVEVRNARAVLIFCRTCTPLYDFNKVGVGRSRTEEDEVILRQADEAEIEANRGLAAKSLNEHPDNLSPAQIKGWLLEQEWEQLEAEGFFN